MVDAVVSFALKRLGDFLIEEAVCLGRVSEEVQWLKDELGWMQCYIASAEEKEDDDDGDDDGKYILRKWLTDITKIAYDAEDVLDNFILQVHHKRMSAGCFGSMSCCIKCVEKVNMRCLGKNIERLKKRINDLPRIRELYKLESSSNNGEGNSSNSLARLTQLRRTTSFSIEEKVVGHEDGTTQLLAKLFDPDRRRFVVSIFGMGGLGKTTLARKLYHHLHVKRKFDCRAWVCVSQDYNTHDLLIRIIRSFGFTTVKIEELQHMGDEDLERYLHESLQEYSYLFVIDDIWKKEAWESIKRAFPAHCNNGSRVIITTRSKEVAENLDERTYVHQLRFLTFEESWQLFCEKAFGKPNANDAEEELKTLGIEMVQKCEGLPLAIIVLGGLLSKKTKPREWKVVRDHIWQDLKKGSIHIPHLFALSFNDLTYQLKLGFLYLSLFPEDFEIDVDDLIRLWVAEGFISIDENWKKKMEDVAKDYFHELINRSLIQIGKISWGRVVTCRVHDLLRELAIEKARELNFLYIYDQMKHSIGDSSVVSSCRRGAVYSGIENRLWPQQSNPSLRSLLLFDRYGYQQDIMTKIRDMYTKFRFLRVLKLDGFKVFGGTLSEEIGKLIHLKYLGLRKSSVINLPKSIFNLRRLQTLDLFSNSIKPPKEFSKLQELRHLYGIFARDLQINSLTKLQSLKYVECKLWMMVNTEKLVNLRELRINNLVSTGRNFFCFDSIAKLKRLEHLVVQLDRNYCFVSLQPLTHCSNLMDLRLHGKTKLPEDIHKVLPNLECLLLKYSCLEDDPMPLLGKLPSLMILNLGSEFYTGKTLFCTAQGFPQLEILKLDDDDGLEEWQVEEGAMPKLRGLTIPENSKMRISERLREIPPPAE